MNGLWWVSLIREVVLGGCGLIRGKGLLWVWPDKRGGLRWGWPDKRGSL